MLEALGPNGILINMARGSVVDEPALIKALQDKTILSAGLDVFAKEPVVPQELLEMDNIVLFPHLGSSIGLYAQHDGPARGRQHPVLDRRQGAADAGAGDAVAGDGERLTHDGVASRRVAADGGGVAWHWLLARGPATAQQGPSEAAKAMVGSWEFSNADRDKRCTITFRTDHGGPGMKLEFDKDCAGLFPFINEIAAWSIAENDFLRLLDAKGKPVLEFSEVESGMYEAPRPGEGILFIQSAAAAGPAPRLPEEMAGTWDIVRGVGQADLHADARQHGGGPGAGAQRQAGLRSLRHPLCAVDLADGPQRAGAQGHARRNLAVRAKARTRRPGSASPRGPSRCC